MSRKFERMCILDWDITSADTRKFKHKKGIPQELADAIEALQKAGFGTTFNTTRDPVEMRDVLHNEWRHLASPDVPLSLESGGMVARLGDGLRDTEVLDRHPLEDDELHEISELAHGTPKSAVKFYTLKEDKQIIWMNEGCDEEHLRKKYPLCDTFVKHDQDLFKLMKDHAVCYVTIQGLREKPKSKMTVYNGKSTMHFLSAGVSKFTGLLKILELYEVDPSNCLIAGDSEPDIAMLKHRRFGWRVVVGSHQLVDDQGILRVKDAKELGEYLHKHIVPQK